MAGKPEDDQTLAPNNNIKAATDDDVSILSIPSNSELSISPELKEGLAKIAADFGAETIAPMHKASTDTEHDVTLAPSHQHKHIDSTMNLQIPQFVMGAAPKNDPNSATMPPDGKAPAYDPSSATMPPSGNAAPKNDPNAATLSPDDQALFDSFFDSNSATMPPDGKAPAYDPNSATMPPSQSGAYDPNGATMPPSQSGAYDPNGATMPPSQSGAYDPNGATMPPSQSGAYDPNGATMAPGQESKSGSSNTAVNVGSIKPNTGGSKFPNVPGYDILGELGRGGMGVVYRAKQRGLGRMVALKMILGGANVNPEDIARFELEARAVGSMTHPNIVQVYEVSEFQGAPFFSLEFVDGGPLDSKLKSEPQPAEWCAQMMLQLSRGMAYAHSMQIIHRDLKPANVLITKDGIGKIADFGLAKKMDADDGKTRAGSIMGTPSYMPPEQASGETADIGPLADIYSLGAMFYEFLTGKPPFRGTTLLQTLEDVRNKEPVAPNVLVASVPLDLQTICLKCLEKDKAKRYPTADELADDIERFIKGEPILARPVGMYTKTLKWAKRNQAKAALIAVSAVAAVTIFIGSITAAIMIRNSSIKEMAARDAVDEKNKAIALELDGIRNETTPALITANTLFDEKKFEEAKDILGKIVAKTSGKDLLKEIHYSASELLQKAEARIKATTDMSLFSKHYDDALFHSSDAMGNRMEARESSISEAAKGLSLVGINYIEDKEYKLKLPDHLSDAEKKHLTDEALELAVILARRNAMPLPDISAEELKKRSLESLEIMEKTRGFAKENHIFHLIKGDLLKTLSKLPEAQAEFEKAKTIAPERPSEFFFLGLGAFNQNDYAAAQDFFEKAVRKDPDMFWANFLTAVCQVRQEQFAAARASLTSCIATRPNLGPAYLVRGIVDGKLMRGKTSPTDSDYSEAFEDFKKAEKYGIPKFDVLVNEGNLFFEMNKFKDAQKNFEEAVKLKPNDPRGINNLALCYRKEGKNVEAIELFTKNIKANPISGDSYHWRGLAYLDLQPKEIQKATEDFIQAGNLRYLNKDKIEDYLIAAELFYSTKNFEKALPLCNLAVQLNPSNSLSHLLKAKILLELNKFAESKTAFDDYFATHDPKKDLPLVPWLTKDVESASEL
jgi:serine/threonine protein kinase/Tfp pilus assembly protein PilF